MTLISVRSCPGFSSTTVSCRFNRSAGFEGDLSCSGNDDSCERRTDRSRALSIGCGISWTTQHNKILHMWDDKLEKRSSRRKDGFSEFKMTFLNLLLLLQPYTVGEEDLFVGSTLACDVRSSLTSLSSVNYGCSIMSSKNNPCWP
jgi:hypothetical protein